MSRQALFLATAVAVGAASVLADSFRWTNGKGDGDWSNPANFTVGEAEGGAVATVAPGAADTVHVPANATVVLDYDSSDASKVASCAAFASVNRIVPEVGSVIDISVADGDTLALSCAITHGTAAANATCGMIVKRGAGELDLNACGSVVSGGQYYDYFCAISVEAGILKLPQTSFAKDYHLGKTTVGANGTLFIARTGSSNPTEFQSLYGSGTITNDHSGDCRMAVTTAGDFSGRIGGRIHYYSGGLVTLGGTESTFAPGADAITVYKNYGRGVATEGNGALNIAKFGMKGAANPSSIGCVSELRTRDYGGAFRYIGTGETTDKDLILWQTQDYPTFLDGGPFGGLVWTGAWDHHNAAMRRLVLQGSNTQECVMSGPIKDLAQRGTNYTFCITKTGTGAWRIAHNDASRMHGVWRIINGTLRYDTIAEAGVNSALGSSTMTYGNIGATLALDANKVNYAFWLGGGADGNRADLEYVGTTNCVSTTRPFAVNGTAGILNNGGGFLRLSGFTATNTPSTLVLGGANALDNVADAIADGGNATMSVVKEGSGTWRLGTGCTFTGALDVKDGTLLVGNPLWSYYRWVIKATYTTDSSSSKYRYVGIKSFGLFDDEGNDRAYGLSHTGDWAAESHGYYQSLPYSHDGIFGSDTGMLAIDEGHFRITKYDGTAMALYTSSSASGVTNLFLHANYAPNFWSRIPQSPPTYGANSSWIVFTMRPRPGAPITSWDYVNTYNETYTYNMISNCVLEASVDGRTWTQLAEVTNNAKPTKGRWQSDNATAYEVGYTTHTTGMPISPGPTDAVSFSATSVSVAAGAMLAANAPTPPIIRSLVIDGRSGGGTIDGFALAPDLTIAITNAPETASLEVPVTFSNMTGLEGARGWTVTVNGKLKSAESVRASESGIRIKPLCTVLYVR